VNHFLYFFQIVKELHLLPAKADIETQRLGYGFLLSAQIASPQGGGGG
jgi:hypothetical protein